MPLFAMKSLAQSASLEDVSGDYKTARRVEQFRISNEAIYFPAFPGNQYLPFEALHHVKVRDTALSVTGTCGKQIPMTCLRLSYDGEFYKDFLFEKRAKAEEVLERIRARRPELEMDIAAPSSMLER
jgi:hypothetical protein